MGVTIRHLSDASLRRLPGRRLVPHLCVALVGSEEACLKPLDLLLKVADLSLEGHVLLAPGALLPAPFLRLSAGEERSRSSSGIYINRVKQRKGHLPGIMLL